MKKWPVLALLALSSSLLAQTEEPAAQSGGSFWQTLIMIAIAICFFYFILWRPEQKRKKAMSELRNNMKKGDRVTAMGIVGTIVRASTDSPTVILKMYDGSKIEVLKAAISEVHPGTEEEVRKLEESERAS